MSYISDNYNISKQFELETKGFSPCVECLEDHDRIQPVNGLFRFAGMIQKLLIANGEADIYDKEHKNVFSCLFHILANYDFLSGLCRNDIACLEIEDDIMSGMYGANVVSFYYDLNFQGKLRLLEMIKKRNDSGGKQSFVYDILRIFMCARLQFYSERMDEFIIYIPLDSKDKHQFCSNLTNSDVLERLIDLFFDLYQKYRVVWKLPMGIVDYEESMKIDHIQIY